MTSVEHLLTLIDAYVSARTPVARRCTVQALQDSDDIERIFDSEMLRSSILRALPLGPARTAEESPIALLLPAARSGPQVTALAFSRMLVPGEALTLLQSPHWRTSMRVDVLDLTYWPDAQLPPVAFGWWLRPDSVDWAVIKTKCTQHPRRGILLGPLNPSGPDWVRSLATLAEAAYPGAGPRWLLRAVAFAGPAALAAARVAGLDLSGDSLQEERAALSAHPDRSVVELVDGLHD
jgi:hypothetical protein